MREDVDKRCIAEDIPLLNEGMGKDSVKFGIDELGQDIVVE